MTLRPPGSGGPRPPQRVRPPRRGAPELQGPPQPSGLSLPPYPAPCLTKHFTPTPLLPREPGLCGLGRAGWGSQAAPAGLCTAASPCTLHMNGCLKLLQQPARGDPSPPALPRRSSFLLCTPGVLRGPRHPQPCSPQPAGPPDAPRGGVGPWPARLSCQQSCFSHVGTSSHKSGLLF